MDNTVTTVPMNSMPSRTQKTNAVIELNWRTEQEVIITVAAKVQIHNSCHYLSFACICQLSFNGIFRIRKSAEKGKFVKCGYVKSFPYEKRLDRFRILKLKKKRWWMKGIRQKIIKSKQAQRGVHTEQCCLVLVLLMIWDVGTEGRFDMGAWKIS